MSHERPVHVKASATPKFKNEISCGPHTAWADEPVDAGGTDQGLMPFELLAASLGACTSMTLRMYADRKGYALEGIDVGLEQRVEGTTRTLVRTIALSGTLDADARQKLLDIANKCPVHRALEGSKLVIETKLAD